jgi:carboxylate-amine ligase
MGTDTGLKSYRSEVFKKFPRTDIPDYFSSYSEFDNYVKLLLKTGCIDKPKKIWWDIRPHPLFPTLEIRICDLPSKVEEVITLAALIQAIIAKLYKLYRQNMGFRLYRRALIQENKWRAVRWGIEGKLIDFGKQVEVPVADLIAELVEFVDDVVDELGSRKEVNHVFTILKEGTSADRQLRKFKETGNLHSVVDQLLEETMEGVV